MKKTLTINLSGTVYHIDEDAYNLLDSYLTNLKHYFRKEEGGDEILDDIERRIAELCAEKQDAGKQIITIVDVEEIIAQIGKPEQMGCEEDDAHSHSTNEDRNSGEAIKKNRRLYRNPDDKILGGVTSGLSLYLGMDVTIARLFLLLFLILGYGTLVPIYIICWILIPEATTAAEKLSMRGESVTVENIGKTVTNAYEKVADGVNEYVNSDKPRTHMQKLGDVLMGIVRVLLKIGMIAFVAMIVPVLFVLAIALFIFVILAIWGTFHGGILIPTLQSYAMIIFGIFAIGIPLAILLWLALGWLLKWKQSTTPKWGLLILWIISIASFLAMYLHLGGGISEISSAMQRMLGQFFN